MVVVVVLLLVMLMPGWGRVGREGAGKGCCSTRFPCSHRAGTQVCIFSFSLTPPQPVPALRELRHLLRLCPRSPGRFRSWARAL